jgi:cytoskeleton protein RodZ
MAKRDPDIEPADEEPVEAAVPTVGEQLRAAREGKGITLEDIAAQTRIPRRHLASIETADWENLPAPTYTIGFAKSYAGAVGLDRTEIGNQLREEMGGLRFASTSNDVFEAADPARTMPKSLVFGAIAAVIVLIVLMSWLNRRSLDQADQPAAAETNTAVAAPAQQAAAPQPAATAAGQGPVVLTATAPIWLQVSEKGGSSLFSGTLQAGQAYAVPASATAPVLKTGKPEALRITVGTTVAPAVGAAATTISNVSLLPANLLRGPAPAASVPSATTPAPAPPVRVRRATPAPQSAPADTPPTTTNSQ